MITYSSKTCIGENKTVGIHRRSASATQIPHKHTFIEIVYICEGSGTEYVNGKGYETGKGDILFIGYEGIHAFEPKKDFSFYEIFFSPALVEEGIITPLNALTLLSLSAFGELEEGQFGKLTFRGEDRREVEFILAAMLREYKSDKTDANTVLEHYLNILLTKMRRESREGETDNLLDDIWEKLRLDIDEHPEENLTLSSLAAKSFYTPSYFSRMFKSRFGIAPMEYVRRQRIEKAKILLTEEDASVDEIISRVGFSDRGSFYHIFSAVTGLTPIEYRMKNRKK